MATTRNVPPRPPKPEPTRSDSKAIVDAIIEATRQLPADASIKTIADKAGVGVASVYRYFPGKDAIYAELGRRLHIQLREEVMARLDRAETLHQAIAACADLSVERSFGVPHVIERVHMDLPVTWHNDEAEAVTNQIIALAAHHLGRFVIGTPEQLHTRAAMLLLILRGTSRAVLMMPAIAPNTDEQRALLEAALFACATQGLALRATDESAQV